MILIVTVDDDNNVAFNNRRQSSDKAVWDKILEIANGSKVAISPYTAKCYIGDGEQPQNIYVMDDPVQASTWRDYCFLEKSNIKEASQYADEIIVFRWNRKYPGDVPLGISFDGSGWKITHSEEFPGTSHEKITMEVYE